MRGPTPRRGRRLLRDFFFLRTGARPEGMRVFIYELDGARLPAADTATRRALFGPPMDWRGNTFASGPTYMDAVRTSLKSVCVACSV